MTDQTATPRPTPITERDILRALQYPDTFIPNEMTPMEIWDYELPGIVAWINGLLEAATQDADAKVAAAREAAIKDCMQVMVRMSGPNVRIDAVEAMQALLTTEAKGVVVFAPDPIDGTPAVFNLTPEAS